MQHPDITAFINQQPVELQPTFRALRQTILQVAPHIIETIQYRIPFYTYYGQLCYLSPYRGAVKLGFCQGAFLANEQGLLVGAGKQVRYLSVKSPEDINQIALQALLQEAMLWNELRRKHANQVEGYARHCPAHP